MTSVRPAAVAGTFYPGRAGALAEMLGSLLGGAGPRASGAGWPKALIVPHAGYVYSGGVAAQAYRTLEAARATVRRVVLLGPVHRVPVRGLALPAAAAFETPLGRVPVDAEAVRAVADLPQVVAHEAAHAYEHSLEVQLPFLQRVLDEFSIVPFAVGMAGAGEVAEVIERLWGGDETLIVLSTDLSHYHGYDEARRIDAATLARIAALSADLDPDEACGAVPLNGLLLAARRRGLAARLLGACNSGDTAGDRDRVVGYSALALEAPGAAPAARNKGAAPAVREMGQTLVGIARGAIAHGLGLAAAPLVDAPRWLAQPGATFVTLTSGGALRGCIGSLEPHRPLGLDVAENARSAAFRDPRFRPVGAPEWPRCEVEVSLLSAAKPLEFDDEAHLLDQLAMGRDGVILAHGSRRATFLPQVWETLPDKRRFLDELMRKAGIPAGTPLTQCTVLRYGVDKWRESEFRLH